MNLESPVKGVFLFGHHDRYPAGGDLAIDLKRLLRLLKDLGANAVWVNLANLNLPLVQSLHDAGIFVAASQNVFSLLADESPESLDLEPPCWPVDDSGKELQGSRLCPTHPGLIERRIAEADMAIIRFQFDALWLDSVRYPGRWEEDTRESVSVCSCPRCRRVKTENDFPKTLLVSRHYPWKVRAISKSLEQLTDTRSLRFPCGLFQVPFDRERVQLWQTEFGQSPDFYQSFPRLFISPMSYHQMMAEPPSWIEQTIRIYEPKVSGRYRLERLLPAIQVEDRPDTLSPEDISEIILTPLRLTRGVIVFFLEALLEADGKPNIKFEMVRAAFRS